MKPFDLERALAGDPVVTRGGKEVQQIVHLHACNRVFNVFAVVNGETYTFNIEGKYSAGHVFKSICPLGSDMDLFMAPKKRTVWVNLYPKGGGTFYYYNDEQAADRMAGYDRIGGKAYPVEIEE